MLQAVYNPTTGIKAPVYDKWSLNPGSFLAKAGMGITDLYINQKSQTRKAFLIRLCENALSFQKDNGRFVTHNTDDTCLHPHCYTCEGLLYIGSKLKVPKYTTAAKKGVSYLKSVQKDNGGMPSFFEANNYILHERSDVLAQTLRLLVLIGTKKDTQSQSINKLFTRLLDFQVKEGMHAGAFIFGYDYDGSKKTHPNAWCTMFAIQALYLLLQSLKDKETSLDLLV